MPSPRGKFGGCGIRTETRETLEEKVGTIYRVQEKVPNALQKFEGKSIRISKSLETGCRRTSGGGEPPHRKRRANLERFEGGTVLYLSEALNEGGVGGKQKIQETASKGIWLRGGLESAGGDEEFRQLRREGGITSVGTVNSQLCSSCHEGENSRQHEKGEGTENLISVEKLYNSNRRDLNPPLGIGRC